MRLMAWRSGRGWSSFHIAHVGTPLCGTPMPDRPIATAEKPAKPSDWARTCERCREIAQRAATGPTEIEQQRPPLTIIGGQT